MGYYSFIYWVISFLRNHLCPLLKIWKIQARVMKEMKSVYHGVSVLWDYLGGLPMESCLQGDQLPSLRRENSY